MKKLFLWIIISSFFVGCNNVKNSDTITFIHGLYPNIHYDTLGNPYLHVKQCTEYRFSTKDSLFIGKFEDYDETSQYYGLTKFYSCKIENNFSRLMRTILNKNYKESYLKELEFASIDDRHIDVIVINQNGTQKFILYYTHEEDCLPNELKQATDFIKNDLIFFEGTTNKPNFSMKIIADLQDSLFQKLPPPPPPIEFIAPIMVNIEDIPQ
jgi:hypothetical protein